MGLLQDWQVASAWYDTVSTFYDPIVAETFWPRHLQRRLLADLQLGPEARVLDVGCGTGVTCELLADCAGRVDAIDISAPQLRRTDGESTVRFVRGDAHQLPYPAETFDAVVSIGAILYFEEPTTALAEAQRVTRPGGSLLVAGFDRKPHLTLNPVENVASIANETFFHTWDRAEVERLLATTGWQDGDSTVTGPAWHPRLARVATARKPDR